MSCLSCGFEDGCVVCLGCSYRWICGMSVNRGSGFIRFMLRLLAACLCFVQTVRLLLKAECNIFDSFGGKCIIMTVLDGCVCISKNIFICYVNLSQHCIHPVFLPIFVGSSK